MQETVEIGRYYPIGYPLAIKSRLFQLFYILFYNQTDPLPRTRPRKSIEKARLILTYIADNCREHLSVETMAEISSLSESHFMKFFKSAVGLPFIEYLNEYRLNIAGVLLSNTEDSVVDIAAACGYDNVSYFNRLFKRKYQTTPSKYRKGGEA